MKQGDGGRCTSRQNPPGAKPPGQWPMFQLWESPEAAILNAIEDFWWLKDAGFTDQSALQRLESFANGTTKPLSDVSLRGFVARGFDVVYPCHFAGKDQVLTQQLEIAGRWVKDEIQWTRSGPSYPPIEWLQKRISLDDIDLGVRRMRTHKDWQRIWARITKNDELWEFSSPRESWENLAGRQGIAVIRDGRCIAHIVTKMN